MYPAWFSPSGPRFAHAAAHLASLLGSQTSHILHQPPDIPTSAQTAFPPAFSVSSVSNSSFRSSFGAWKPKLYTHYRLFFFSPAPHLIYHQILLAVPSKLPQISTVCHSLRCNHAMEAFFSPLSYRHAPYLVSLLPAALESPTCGLAAKGIRWNPKSVVTALCRTLQWLLTH